MSAIYFIYSKCVVIYFCINNGEEIVFRQLNSETHINPPCEQYYSGLLWFILFIYLMF